MTHPLIVRRDMEFLLYDWLGMDTLFEKQRFSDHSRETVDQLLDLSEKLAVDTFMPHYKDADRLEPRLVDGGVQIHPAIGPALKQYAELGLFAAGFPVEFGGIALPYVACAASFAYFAAANTSTAAYPMLTIANARLISTFGSRAQIEYFVRPQLDGRWFGTMCLSEPQAGSSLADIRTRAIADGGDELGARYLLTGNKMWISGGDQDASENIVHLMLAKVPLSDGIMPEGTRGLSLFIVPKLLADGRRNDVEVAGLNHKMGYRGTANCLLNLGEREGAIGWMVGQPGLGLKQMFLMMNEARIGVGIGAAAIGYRSFRHSSRYAQERLQGRLHGERSGPPVAIVEHPDVKRMLLAQKAYTEGALALCLYCAKLVDEDDNSESAELLGLLTPIAKTWSSEYGLMASDIAIQIHGGYGYTRDFDVEQLYRDNRLNPIHEGTTGIQAVDLLGRKLLNNDGSGFAVLQKRISASIDMAAKDPALRPAAEILCQCWDDLGRSLEKLRTIETPSALDNATPFLWAFGHAVVGWIWLEQAIAAARLDRHNQTDAKFVAGKRAAFRFFFEAELPKIAAWMAAVDRNSDLLATTPSNIF